MSKLDEVLKGNKIDSRRLLSASRKLEALRPEDRRVRQAKAKVRLGTASDAEKELAKATPRSGKPVSPRLLRDALQGGEGLSGAAKRRVVRVVNHLLTQKKKSEVKPEDLFGA